MRKDFDYGLGSQPIGGQVKVWPVEGEFTGLVDADAIPYVVGYCSDPVHYLQAKNSGDFYSHPNWIRALGHASYLLNEWLTKAECDSAILFVTDSENNFRNKIAVSRPYKGERDPNKPPFFYELKQWLIDYHGARLSRNCEADDEISIEAWKRIAELKSEGVELWGEDHKRWSDFCIISKDKDLNIIPSWHCDINTGERYWVDKLGELIPVYKATEVNDYAMWPLFNGTPVNIEHCSFIRWNADETIDVLPFCEHPCSTGHYKSVENEIWFWSESGEPKMQDIFKRGKNTGKGKFKRISKGKVTVDTVHRLKGTGLKFFYSQILTGDSSDCYNGLQSVGASTAFKELDHLPSEKELYDKVLSMYVGKHRHLAKEKMLEQSQLAWMQTYDGELWQHLEGQRNQSFPL